MTMGCKKESVKGAFNNVVCYTGVLMTKNTAAIETGYHIKYATDK